VKFKVFFRKSRYGRNFFSACDALIQVCVNIIEFANIIVQEAPLFPNENFEVSEWKSGQMTATPNLFTLGGST
jgi:hypothetical protein